MNFALRTFRMNAEQMNRNLRLLSFTDPLPAKEAAETFCVALAEQLGRGVSHVVAYHQNLIGHPSYDYMGWLTDDEWIFVMMKFA